MANRSKTTVSNPEKRKVLIIEDDKAIALALAVRLRASHYEVLAAYDGVTGLSTALKERPDLIILDISMPGADGFLVAERMQNNVHLAGIPMIFVTASKRPGLRERAQQLGAVGFFEKPYEAQELLAAIQSALG